MKNELMLFENGDIRCIQYNGEVWFVGKDITIKLNYSNSSDAIKTHVDDEDKILLSSETQSEFAIELDYKQLGQRGGWLISEDGVFDLIYNSKLPKAKQFKRKVREIIKTVQQTGKFDSIEQKIKLIKDEKERELSLKLYQLKNILKTSPNDMITAINYRQTEQEFKQYKQDKRIEEQEKKLIKQSKVLEDQKKKLDNIFIIGDRIQFVNEVNRIARATGKQQSEIYSNTYLKLKSMYGIDLSARVRNKREELQSERLNGGKKPYSPTTLKSKINNLAVADELNIWNELGRSLNAVNDDLLT